MHSGDVAATLRLRVGSCRLHGIDPWEKLHTLLRVINDRSVRKVGDMALIHAARAPVVEGEARQRRRAGMAEG